MDLRRFKDIIAIKSGEGVVPNDTIVAFHASNLEVAEISEDSFNEMAPIHIKTGLIPEIRKPKDLDASTALHSWNEEQNPEVRSGKLDFGIRSITLNVNQICNLKCAYCAAGGDGTYGEPMNQISVEKTLPQLKFFMSSVKKNSSFAISFVGGEPLLHPKAIKAIYDYVITEGANLNITPLMKIVTNGTLLSGETLEVVRSMKLNLTISFDGTKEYNDKTRPSKDGSSTTDKVLQGIKNLAESRGLVRSIHISAITTKTNPHLFENYLFFRTLPIDSYDFVFANEESDIETQQKYIADFNKVMAHSWEIGGEKELRRIKSVDHYFRALDNQQRTENFCGAGKNYLMVDAKNRLYTCVWEANNKSEVVGTGNEINYDEISKLSKSLVELNNCQTCWARYLCGGGCMYINKMHTGDKHKKSDLFCERTRNLILSTIMYYKLARVAN